MISRLSTLYELQHIDDQLDQLEELRGDLPLTVNELNGRMSEIQVQIDTKEAEKKEAVEKQQNNEEEVERLSVSLKKFKAQLYQVRNNKEYDALTKEIDHSETEISKMEEENIELENLVEKLKMDIDELSPKLDEFQDELKEKETELKKIIKSNERDEEKLKEEREKIVEKVRKSDYNTYMRIRKAKGGGAVATVNRGACTGCHNVVPPQRQIEIRASKRLYICESCGRLLVAGEIAENIKAK